eukprot:m.53127 g.53127  ORF g.53127 m.53127 type:complete len:535 (-) comp9142_c0_seq1:1357-2961(-)
MSRRASEDAPPLPIRVVKEGFLIKSALGRSRFGAINWKQRWFVLSADGLRYYKTKEEVSKRKASGVLPLNQICMIEEVAQSQTPTESPGHFEGRHPLFQVGFADGARSRILLVQAADEADRDAWIHALRSQFPRSDGVPWSKRYHVGVQVGKEFSCCATSQPAGCANATFLSIGDEHHDYEQIVRSLLDGGAPRSSDIVGLDCGGPPSPGRGYENAQVTGGVSTKIEPRLGSTTPIPSPRKPTSPARVSSRSHEGSAVPPSRSPDTNKRKAYKLPTETVCYENTKRGPVYEVVDELSPEYAVSSQAQLPARQDGGKLHEYEVVDLETEGKGSTVLGTADLSSPEGALHEYEKLPPTSTRLPPTPGGYSKLTVGTRRIESNPPPLEPRIAPSLPSSDKETDQALWHVYSMPRDAVKKALTDLPQGSFVVRNSTSDQGVGAVVLCVRGAEEVVERKIAQEGNRFLILEPGVGIKRFTSLPAVVAWVSDALHPAATRVLATQHHYVNEVVEVSPMYAMPNADEMRGFGSDGSGDEAD